MTLGEKIRSYREQKGWSQKELADKIFVSEKTISNYEKERNQPTPELLQKMASVFFIHPGEFLDVSCFETEELDEMTKRALNHYQRLPQSLQETIWFSSGGKAVDALEDTYLEIKKKTQWDDEKIFSYLRSELIDEEWGEEEPIDYQYRGFSEYAGDFALQTGMTEEEAKSYLFCILKERPLL